MIALFIPGKPIAFARARSNGTRRYTPEPQASYGAAVATMARATMAKAGIPALEGPIEVSYRATFDWPATWSQKRKDRTRWKTSKPDVDNCAKLILDALKGVAFRDDAKVSRMMAEKVYGRPEGATITVMALLADEVRA